MPTINGKVCVVNGRPVDKVFSNGKQVYGRNLLTGTSNELTTVTRSNWGSSPASPASGTYGAGKYYSSAYIENTTPVGINLYVSVYVGGKFIHNLSGEAIPAGQSGAISFTFDIFDEQLFASAFVGFVTLQTKSYTYKYKDMMITRTPSPWTPAPEDVLKGYIAAPRNLTATVIDLSTEKLDWE